MKVFWLLLFGICSFRCTAKGHLICMNSGFNDLSSEYCLIKIRETDGNCILKYTLGYIGEEGIGNETTWGTHGCEVQTGELVVCYCNQNYCNDILNFEDQLKQAAETTKENPHLSNCLRREIKEECAVGKPEKMIFEKRKKGHSCYIEFDHIGQMVISVGQHQIGLIMQCTPLDDYDDDNDEDDAPYSIYEYCYCGGYRCNIQNYTHEAIYQLGSYDVLTNAFANHVKTCGDSVAVYDPEGTKRCAKVFKKDENGTCTTDFAFVPNEPNRMGCFISDPEMYDNGVTCICEDGSYCEGQKFHAHITMGRDGFTCVEPIPDPLPSTSTYITTTTTTTNTIPPPEQLTCWASDISTVTKDKTNSVCFIDYAMINSRCELRGKGIVEDENGTPGCRIVDNRNKVVILRCTCGENRCNQQVDDMWEKVESNNTEHVELIECVDRLIHGETLPTSGTSVVAPSPTPLSETEEAKSSTFFGLFIGSAAFNGLQMVTIVALIVALVKMKKKGGEAKQGTAKIEQKEQQKATAIQIEKPVNKESSTVPPPATVTKPVDNKDSSTVPKTTTTTKTADQQDSAADATAISGGSLDNCVIDTSSGTTDSESTGPEGTAEVRVAARALNRN